MRGRGRWPPGKAPAKNPQQPQLFHLAVDLGEEKNLAMEQPEKLKAMQALLARLRGEQK